MPRLKFFTVSGCGSFPFQLLFLDECWPARIVDAGRILLACPTQAPKQSITLATYQYSAPRLKEWADNQWPVLKVE